MTASAGSGSRAGSARHRSFVEPAGNSKGRINMYVRALNFVCREETDRDDILSVYRKIAVMAKERDGFLGSSLLMRQHACNGMALMYWRDESAANEAGKSITTLLGEHAHRLLEHPPEVTGYDVIENGIIPEHSASSD